MTSTGRPTRRALLLSAGGLVAAGGGYAAGSAASADASRSQPSAASHLPSPGEDLMEEHGLLIRILLIYRHLSARQAAGRELPAPRVHAAALIVHDYIEAFHEPLEEAYVFPLLRRVQHMEPLVSTLLLQHARGRQLTQLILAESNGSGPVPAAAALRVSRAMEAFVQMYEPHEAREDTVVYPAFRALLTPERLADLAGHFVELQREQFGNGAFATMVAKVAEIERSLGIYDLAQFTPPNLTPPS